MPANIPTGKQAALDTHRRADESVTTARAAAANAAQQARAVYDATKAGGWTAAEINKAGLRAPTASRPRNNNPTAPTRHTTGTDGCADAEDDVAGAA